MDDGAWLDWPSDVWDDEDTSHRRRAREERMRNAFLQARATYDAKRDTDEWFMEGLSYDALPHTHLDAKTQQRIQMCIEYMYYKQRYAEAFAWSVCLLRRMHVLGTSVVWTDGLPSFPTELPHDKTSWSMAHSAVARETLDTALRCVLHFHTSDHGDIDCLVAAALDRVQLDPAAYQGMALDEQKRKECAWTTAPGLAMTLGDVCMRMQYTRCALESYALVMGMRGAQWYVCKAVAQALSRIAEPTKKAQNTLLMLAQATSVCALQSCPPSRRTSMAKEIVSGQLVGSSQPVHGDPDGTDCGLSEAAMTGILWALQKRGGPALLASRLPTFMAMAQQYLRDTSTPWMACHDESLEKTWSSARAL